MKVRVSAMEYTDVAKEPSDQFKLLGTLPEINSHTISINLFAPYACLWDNYLFFPLTSLTGKECSPVRLTCHLHPIDIQRLHDSGSDDSPVEIGGAWVCDLLDFRGTNVRRSN